MANSELEYNVANMRLRGNIDGFAFDTLAFSGGRGGTKTPGAAKEKIVNNPFLTSLKYSKKIRGSIGGPLPSGVYKLSLHTVTDEVRLTPVDVADTHNRDGFLIHGRGKIGSQGCIVPQNFTIVQKIYQAVKTRQNTGKPPITISVFATGDLDYYLRKLYTV